jgi:hypothetical protein
MAALTDIGWWWVVPASKFTKKVTFYFYFCEINKLVIILELTSLASCIYVVMQTSIEPTFGYKRVFPRIKITLSS